MADEDRDDVLSPSIGGGLTQERYQAIMDSPDVSEGVKDALRRRRREGGGQSLSLVEFLQIVDGILTK